MVKFSKKGAHDNENDEKKSKLKKIRTKKITKERKCKDVGEGREIRREKSRNWDGYKHKWIHIDRDSNKDRKRET